MITLTEKASQKIEELLETPDDMLRIAVRPGGCSGFSYEMFFDKQAETTDIIQSFGKVKVVVDEMSNNMLQNASLDYKNSLQENGFKISNPNAQRTCGCGSSFS